MEDFKIEEIKKENVEGTHLVANVNLDDDTKRRVEMIKNAHLKRIIDKSDLNFLIKRATQNNMSDPAYITEILDGIISAYEANQIDLIEKDFEYISFNSYKNIDTYISIFKTTDYLRKFIAITQETKSSVMERWLLPLVFHCLKANQDDFDFILFDTMIQWLVELFQSDRKDFVSSAARVFSQIVITNKENRNCFVETVGYDLIFGKYSLGDSYLKKEIIDLVSAICYFDELPEICIVCEFLLSVLQEPILEHRNAACKGLFFCAKNDKNTIGFLIDNGGIEYISNTLYEIAERKEGFEGMKFLLDLASLIAETGRREVAEAATVFKFFGIDDMTVVNSAINLFSELCRGDITPFPAMIVNTLIATCRDLLKSAPAKIKINTCVFISVLIRHLNSEQMENLFFCDIPRFVFRTVPMCSGRDLFEVMKLVSTLVTANVSDAARDFEKNAMGGEKELYDNLEELVDCSDEEVAEIAEFLLTDIAFGPHEREEEEDAEEEGELDDGDKADDEFEADDEEEDYDSYEEDINDPDQFFSPEDESPFI